MRCPHCHKQLDGHIHMVDGTKVPVFECTDCKAKFLDKKKLLAFEKTVREKVLKWAKSHSVQTV